MSVTQQEAPQDIFHDPRLRQVDWRDLVRVSPLERFLELLLPASWLAASWIAAFEARCSVWWYAPAVAFSFLFFLAGLRVVHNAFHDALGLSRKATDAVLRAMGVLMLGSLHAVRFNHLRHHSLLMGDEDVEGRSAAMSGWKALAFGPKFTVLLHVTAWKRGSRRLKVQVAGELALNAITLWLVFGALHNPVLRYHYVAMLAAHCMTAYFAVWTVHHHCDRTHYIARTLRNRIKNVITFDMFRHIEHHLFPAVPTCHLSRLSERLDRAAPELKEKIVF